MDSAHTILSHSLIVICNHPPTPPIRVYGVNNKSCVTSQITQTAYHLFIVVYHNNSSVRTKATASQTRAFVNEFGRLPDLKINWQYCCFLSLLCVSLLFFFFSVYPPETIKKIDGYEKVQKISWCFCCGLLFNLTILSLAISLKEKLAYWLAVTSSTLDRCLIMLDSE